MKTASFTIHTDPGQSTRWRQAASLEGFASVGSWAARALDAYLKARLRAGRPLPLSWSWGRFPVRLENGETISVRGWTSPPFFIFRGTLHSGRTPNTKNFTLLHQQDGRLIATLRSHAQAASWPRSWRPSCYAASFPPPVPS